MKDIYRQTGVYRITNIVTGESYIGKTGMNFGDRWDSHRSLLKNGKHTNSALQDAWVNYGEDNFEFAIIELADDPDQLKSLEMKYISEYRERNLCYNIADGGDVGHNSGKHLSDSTKRKIGEKNRINMTGRKAPDETKRRMSESQKRRYRAWTDEDRVEYGKQVAEYASGYKWSDESKVAFSMIQWEKPNSAKYTADDIRNIRRKREEGLSLKELAKEYGTSPSYISSIVHRRRWAHI